MYSAGVHSSKTEAHAHLSTIEADLRRGAWIDPRHGRMTLRAYAEEWLAQRNDLAVRTEELYFYLLEQHILPTLGNAMLASLSTSKIRSWNASLSKEHPSTAAKAYRLVSALMRTAVTDGFIVSSPCKISGGGVERPMERPIATIAEVERLEAAMPQHLRLIVLLATWCQLRRAELLGLRRKDLDLKGGTLRIEQSRTVTMKGKSLTKEPKSAAGRRTVAIPPFLISRIEDHLRLFTPRGPDDLVFRGATGIPLTPNVLQASWQRARATVGRTDLRLHDLRHTGLTLAAATGATTVELMHRAGHSSSVAAMRYQHATEERDRVIATALGDLAKSNSPLRAEE
jgi:integrase